MHVRNARRLIGDGSEGRIEKISAEPAPKVHPPGEETPLITNPPRSRAVHGTGGFIALMLVVMVTAMTVVYGLTVALMSVDETNNSASWLAASKSRTFTSACIDNALSTLRNNSNASGNVNIDISNVNCVATISGSGNTRQIVANASSTDPFSRDSVDRLNVNVNINTNPFTVIEYKDILD